MLFLVMENRLFFRGSFRHRCLNIYTVVNQLREILMNLITYARLLFDLRISLPSQTNRCFTQLVLDFHLGQVLVDWES